MTTPKIAFSAWRNFQRIFPLMRDERVPLGLKIATGVMGLLIVSPLDVFGDIPVLGLLDDAVLLTLLAVAFVALATRMTQKVVTPRAFNAQAQPGRTFVELPRAHPVQKP
jgi:uncharacterized membrane protein YkvA (DUF1232 family)